MHLPAGCTLDKDTTLIIRYPQGYTVTSADPVPDQQGSDGLYGPACVPSGPGNPRSCSRDLYFRSCRLAWGLSLS